MNSLLSAVVCNNYKVQLNWVFIADGKEYNCIYQLNMSFQNAIYTNFFLGSNYW